MTQLQKTLYSSFTKGYADQILSAGLAADTNYVWTNFSNADSVIIKW